jgi:glutamine cyclotransferase
MADTLTFKLTDKKCQTDSVKLFSDAESYVNSGVVRDIRLPVSELMPGNQRLVLEIKLKKGKRKRREVALFVVSDIKPGKYVPEVLETLPHDTSAFVQGLLLHDGLLYESTGLKGRSRLRILDPETGECLKDKHTGLKLFNEGIAFVGDTLYMLTWKDSLMLKFDADLNELGSHKFKSEGWGMLSHNDTLYFTNGTNEIIRYDPVKNMFLDTLRAADNKGPVYYLNELEWIDGMIWANIYGKDSIVIIDPVSGKVKGVLNGKGLIDRKKYPEAGVMNGIAYDPVEKSVYLTGKNWPFIKVCLVRFDD